MNKRSSVSVLLVFCSSTLAGCSGWQSVLDPHSVEAGHLAQLFWFFTAVCAVVWLLIAAALVRIVMRRKGFRTTDLPPNDQAHELRKAVIVSALTAGTAIILVIFTFASFYATRGFMWTQDHVLTIKVTGQQWWWQLEYQNHDPSQIITTANEIHIPAGQPVTLDLEASDVIHSFWVPDLMGKQDLIPGRKNTLTISADKPGLFRGQCAEFCGLQHAHMAMLVFVQTPTAFEAWRNHQLAAAAKPGDPVRVRGMNIFIHSTCATCHSISGTDADGQTGPDLTHFGERATIAAGTLSNTAANLSRWLDDPQAIKPGTNMPQVPLSAPDRMALVAYLEGLK